MEVSSPAQVLPGGVLEIRMHARKGRSLYTTRLVKGGEIVLDEAPLLLLVAPEVAQSTCTICLRAVGPQERIECSGCHQLCFCSASCRQAAQDTPWLHSGSLCSAHARLATLGLLPEEQAQLWFLLQALALRHAGTAESERRFAALCGLVGQATEAERTAAARLAPSLAAALQGLQNDGAGPLHLDVEELATLLRKEQLNSYGVLAAQQPVAAAVSRVGFGCGGARVGCGRSSSGGGSCGAACSASGGGGCVTGLQLGAGDDGERKLRGSALYVQASLINHECLPNVARFDFFDSGRPDSTHVTFRALHDLPPGTELAQSYVPLHWSLPERQAQCKEVYGFACTCPRCQTESQWSDEEEGGDEGEWETDNGEEDMEDDDEGEATATAAGGSGDAVVPRRAVAGSRQGEDMEMSDVQAVISAPPGEEGPLEAAYLRLFLLKYMCTAPGCYGTAAPAKPGSSLFECNVCGRTRSEREFLRDLENLQHR